MSTLLYDPDCGFCTHAAQVLQRLRLDAQIAPLSDEATRRSGIDAERAQCEIPFVDDAGRVRYGAPAIAGALATGETLPRLLAHVLAAPGVDYLAAVVYRWVARHRHQLPGGSAACALPSAR